MMKTDNEPDKPELSDDDKCKCGKNEKSAWHTCPYASEINNSDAECTCCEECTYKCAMDI